MQIKKSELKKLILKVSRKNFLENGFKCSSLRNIASESGCSLANIYTYFPGKDDIFNELVKDTLKIVRNFFSNYDFEKYLKMVEIRDINDFDAVFSHNNKTEQMNTALLDFLEQHRDNLFLLLFRSEGSLLSGFREELIELFTERFQYFYYEMVRLYPDRMRSGLSPFMMHNFAVFYVNFYSEFIMHGIPREKMEIYQREFYVFSEGGMSVLFKK